MADKILTVVVPTYNMEKYLDKCLSSLIIDDEGMQLLEVLVINDGSKDRSSEIAHSYETRYPGTFRVVDKENGNYGSCINRGISEARGKYFRILDADDYYCTEAFQSFITGLKSVNADMIVTPMHFFGEKDDYYVSVPSEVTRDCVFNITDISPDSIPLRMHSITFRHQVLINTGLQLSTGVSYTDTEFCFLPLQYTTTVVYKDEAVYNYNAFREGQTCSSSSMAKSTYSMFIVSSRLCKHYLMNANFVNSNVLRLWERWLTQICGIYYYSSLSICRSDDDSKLSEVDSMIQIIPAVEEYISQLCIHHIHFVKMWREKGRRYTHPLVRVHNAVWSILDPIWLQFLKWVFPSRI